MDNTSAQPDPNPWLTIPADDYEGHMNAATVGQLSVLNKIFADTISEFAPPGLAVLGCATGNGFEHIDPETTQRIVGIDINAEYLEILKQRHGRRLGHLTLICSDIASHTHEPHAFDLIFAALLFEYVNPAQVLPVIATWLKPGGILAVVLQLPSPVAKIVSETAYTSLQALTSIMRVVDPAAFSELASQCGLRPIRSWQVDLCSGKGFNTSYYKKDDARDV